jgi:type II secretory pathway pseudopilin PulG
MVFHARSAQVPRPLGEGCDHGGCPLPRRQAGFTLFEVGISLVLVAFGVVSVIILFPVGIKAQEAARYKIYAAGMAMQFVESYNTSHNANPAFELEAPNNWDVHVTGRNMSPDLEARCSSYRFGMYPLPTVIAQRLDSDNDEIQNVLSQGGYLYYPQPLANTGLTDTGFLPAVAGQSSGVQANDAQKVVMAVEGYAQNNALYALPQKAWPYYAAYPSPPIINSYASGGGNPWSPNITVPFTWGGGQFYLAEDVITGDPDVQSVWCNTIPPPPLPPPGTAISGVGGLYLHQCLGPNTGQANNTSPVCLATATGYFACALWYAKKKGLDTLAGGNFYNGNASLTDVASVCNSPPSSGNLALQVNALRYLANAAVAVSGFWDASCPPTIPVLSFTAGGSSQGGFVLNQKMISNYHEMSLALGARFVASFPYDWGSPRMLQRAISMDNPLIEFDLLTPQAKMLKGSVYINGTPAQAWRPVTAQPVRNLGLSATYPRWSLNPPGGNVALVSENMLDAAQVPNVPPPLTYGANNPFWGDGQNDFSLNAPFAPADRCRQLVFWTVDWQSYEDCETAPSAPVDAGKYMIGAPYSPQGGGYSFQLQNPGFMAWQQFGYLNPEKAISFPSNQTGRPTGAGVTVLGLGNAGNQAPDGAVQGLPNAPLFNGVYGADRNFNGLLDRGPLSKSVRLRAVLLARFNYYDLRVPAPIR